MIDGAVVVKGAATLPLPSTRNRRDRRRRVHVDGTVAAPREPIAEPEETPLGGADQLGEVFDLDHGQASDRRCPGRRLGLQMALEFPGRIGVFLQICPVRVAIPKQHMHDRCRQRAIGARPQDQAKVRLLARAVPIGIDGDDLGAAVFPSLDRVHHHVDLGIDRIGPPNHDHVGFRHFPGISAMQATGAGDEAAERQGRADGRILPGVVFCMAQPLDAVAHDQPHGAGIVIGPDGFRAIALFGLEQALGDLIEGGIPRNWHEIIRALGPDPAQRPSQSARMMDAFCVSCDLGADHAVGVAVTARATQPADPIRAQDLDFQCTGARAIMGTNAISNLNGFGHASPLLIRYSPSNHQIHNDSTQSLL